MWWVLAMAACGDPSSEEAVRRTLEGFDPADLSRADPAAWSGVSAPWMYAEGAWYAPSLVELEPGCPEVETKDGVTTMRGGCVDANGTEWFGEVEQDGDRVTYRGFGSAEASDCEHPGGSEWDGTFEGAADLGNGVHAFRAVVRLTEFGELGPECEPADGVAAFVYEGTVEIAGEDLDGDGVGDVTTWSGAGEYGNTEVGRAKVETVDEVVDKALCASEAASGATTVTSGSHALALTYDGATDCEGEGTARWALDGVDQGEVTGVYCSTGPGGRASIAGLVVAAGLALRRRQRR